MHYACPHLLHTTHCTIEVDLHTLPPTAVQSFKHREGGDGGEFGERVEVV